MSLSEDVDTIWKSGLQMVLDLHFTGSLVSVSSLSDVPRIITRLVLCFVVVCCTHEEDSATLNTPVYVSRASNLLGNFLFFFMMQ